MKIPKIEFLNAALGKFKPDRALNHVYQSKMHLIASDGHRVHYLESKSDTERYPHNDCDLEYPDISPILKFGNETSVAILDNQKELKKLMSFLNIFVNCDKNLKTLQSEAIELNFADNSLTMTLEDEDFSASAKIDLKVKTEKTLYINAKYLLDVLKFADRSDFESIHFYSSATYENRSDKLHINFGEFTAIIMPLQKI